jgi:hypothetical protein
MLSSSYIQQQCDFTTREVKEVTLRTKNIKAKDYVGIPVDVQGLLRTVRDETDILTNPFNIITNRKDFPADWKLTIIHLIYKGKGKG